MKNYTCEQVSDLLPDLVAGTLSNATSDDLAVHMHTCAACTAELTLLHELRAESPAAPVEMASRIATAVAARPVARRAPFWGTRNLAIAATIAVAVMGTAIANEVQRDSAARTAAPTTDSVVAPVAVVGGTGSAALSAAESASTSAPLTTAAGYAPVVGPTLGARSVVSELTEAQLEALLAEMDG